MADRLHPPARSSYHSFRFSDCRASYSFLEGRPSSLFLLFFCYLRAPGNEVAISYSIKHTAPATRLISRNAILAIA